MEYAPPIGVDAACPNKADFPFAPPEGTDRLCENLVNARFDQLSQDNIRIFKDRLLDITGCIFGGAVRSEERL